MELSKRMSMVAQMVPTGSVLCDIGCDHGFVSIELIRREICPHIIAADVRKGPLQRASKHIGEAGLSDRIETRLSDGLKEIHTGEADGFLAAGMGGRLIIRIMEEGLGKIREMSYMILQPQSELGVVRAFLREQGFQIVKEDMVSEEGKFYPAMLVYTKSMQEGNLGILFSKFPNADKDRLTAAADQYGPGLILEKHPVLASYLNWWEKRQMTILSAVEQHPERFEEVRAELERIKFVRSLTGFQAD